MANNEKKFRTKAFGLLSQLVANSANGSVNYKLFLGEGASEQSGWPTREQMVDEWKALIFKGVQSKLSEVGKADDLEHYDSWYELEFGTQNVGGIEEFGNIFEFIYRTKESRLAFLDAISDKQHISASIGYSYLAALLREKIFGTILTTNYDNLIEEVLYKTTNIRPITIPATSDQEGFHLSSNRPKIIKLHGDFFFNHMRNTDHEVAAMDVMDEQKIVEAFTDSGVIIYGYDGDDESFTQTLIKHMHVNNRFLALDLHWCLPAGLDEDDQWILASELPSNILELKRQFPERVQLYRAPNFDNAMAEFHRTVLLNVNSPETSDHDIGSSAMLVRHSLALEPTNELDAIRAAERLSKATPLAEDLKVREATGKVYAEPRPFDDPELFETLVDRVDALLAKAIKNPSNALSESDYDIQELDELLSSFRDRPVLLHQGFTDVCLNLENRVSRGDLPKDTQTISNLVRGLRTAIVQLESASGDVRSIVGSRIAYDLRQVSDEERKQIATELRIASESFEEKEAQEIIRDADVIVNSLDDNRLNTSSYRASSRASNARLTIAKNAKLVEKFTGRLGSILKHWDNIISFFEKLI